MTDHKDARQLLADITAGLEGVTPGPWRAVEFIEKRTYIKVGLGRILAILPWGRGVSGNAHRDAAHIARCDPDTMQAIADLVAEQDRRIAKLEAERQWQPIALADKDISYIHDMAGLRIGCSHPVWVRDEDGRIYEAIWSDDGKRAYWWDLEGESPVDPFEFQPHPLARAILPASPHEGTQS